MVTEDLVISKPEEAIEAAPAAEVGEEERAKEKKAKRLKRKRVMRALDRIAGFIIATCIVAGCACLALEYILVEGPSESLRDVFVGTMSETRRFRFIPRIFLTEDEMSEITDKGDSDETVKTDQSLISLPADSDEEEDDSDSGADEYGLVDEDGDGIILVNVKGSTYVGYMLVVLDPTRIFVGMPNGYGGTGLTLDEMVEKYDAIGGINAGAFRDDSGTGMGGDPEGLTIVDGVCYNSDSTSTEATAGFDENGLLHVGNYTYDECVENGIFCAASFGPALISNGEITSSVYNSTSLNPRTAIAQRADGAVLMLVIDGRQVHSAGATYADVAELLLSYGAVNACNLDGGSSTTMYFEGEYINSCSAGYGKRLLPTAFLIKK